MTTSSILSSDVRAKPQIFSYEKKLDFYQKISSHRCFGSPAAIFSAVILTVSVVALFLGGGLCSFMPEDLCLWTDIVFPFIVPAVLAIVFLVIPLNIYAYIHHRKAMSLQERLARSNYHQILQYCEEEEASNKKSLVQFIENEVLLAEYSRAFSSITLFYSRKQIPAKDSSEASPHDSLIDEAISSARDRVFMNEMQRLRQEEKEAEENSPQASVASSLSLS